MVTYVSILRGINVSGHKIIQMTSLKVLHEMLGFQNVTTYIQSGNVVFRSSESDTIKLSEQIENETIILPKSQAKLVKLFVFLYRLVCISDM